MQTPKSIRLLPSPDVITLAIYSVDCYHILERQASPDKPHMTFLNWYHIEQTARGDLRKYSPPIETVLAARKNKTKPRKAAPSSKSRLFFAVSILVLLSVGALYTSEIRAMADSSPPTSAGTHSSPHLLTPTSPTVLVSPSSVSVLAIGSTFTVQIKVQNMDQFNGWDIEIWTYSAYSAVINATSLSISGNDFEVNASSGSAFEIVHCVNGRGTGCTSSDRPGIVHSAYGNTAVLTGNGLLFTITYQVIGVSSYSAIGLVNDQVSSPSSGNGVAHASISGNYGAVQVTAGGGGGGRSLRV